MKGVFFAEGGFVGCGILFWGLCLGGFVSICLYPLIQVPKSEYFDNILLEHDFCTSNPFTVVVHQYMYMVLNIRFVVGILTVPYIVSQINAFPVSAAISDCRSLLESL